MSQNGKRFECSEKNTSQGPQDISENLCLPCGHFLNVTLHGIVYKQTNTLILELTREITPCWRGIWL